MGTSRCDGCRKNSNKFPARNQRRRELDGQSFDSWPRRLKVISSKYPGNEYARSAIVGWQDPFAFDDILKGNSAFARKFALPPHEEAKSLIEQDLGMEAAFHALPAVSSDQ